MSRKYIYTLLSCLLCLLPMHSVAQSINQCEYWFDDGFGIRQTIGMSGQDALLDTYINTGTLSSGAHKLYYRFRQSDGKYTAVATASFFKFGLGESKLLEYWFDGDRENAHRLPGETPSDDGDAIVFAHDLDLSGITPGHHRLYYRVVSQNGKTAGSVSMTPVMVKSKYDNIDTTNVTVTKYSIAVDDEESVELTLPQTGQEVVLEKSYDVRDLPKGSHQLNLRFVNTVGLGVSEKATFTVMDATEASIKLTAEVFNGLVSIRFNSIPNDTGYRIYRKDANGATAAVKGSHVGNYPATVSYTDDPAAGTYTYYAKSICADADGETHVVTSNEAVVTVTADEAVVAEYGYISGDVVYDKSNDYRKRDIVFSDGTTIKSDLAGHFFRDKIPVGTHLTVTAQENSVYSFSTEEVTVKAGWNKVSIKAVGKEGCQVVDTDSPLQFDSFVEVMPGQYYRFKVKNVSRQLWSGTISVKAALKEYMDNPPSTEITSPTNAQVLAGSMASFTARQNYNCAYSDKISLSAGESKEVYIPEKMFVWEGNKYYYIYFECNSGGDTKLIALNPDYNLEANPLLRLIDEGSYVNAQNEVTEEDVTFAVNLIMHMLSSVKEIDGKLGDFSDYLKDFKECVGYDIEYGGYDYLVTKIEHAASYDEVFYDAPLWHFKTIVYTEANNFEKEINKFREEIATLVRGSKDVLKVLKYVQQAMDYAKAYNEWQDMDDTERMIYFSERLLDFAASHGDPFTKILKMYLDVTKITIANAKKLGAAYHGGVEADYFSSENQLFESERVRPYKHNKHIDFRIQVEKDWWVTSRYFDADDVKRQIYEVTVTARNRMGNSTEYHKAEATFEPVVDGDYVYLRQTGIAGALSAGDAIEDMWMNIRWKNGRTTRVPIRHGKDIKGNGVKYEDFSVPFYYTITFKSGTREDEHMADIIQLDD